MQDRRGHCVQVTPGMPWRPQDTAPRGVIEREFTSRREKGIALHKAGMEETAKFFATERGVTGFELGSASFWLIVPK